MPRHLLGAVLLVAGLAAPSQAQATDTTRGSADSADVLVLDHDFSAEGEFTRVFLQDGQVYRAELSSPDVVLGIVGVVRTTPIPRVYPFLPTDTPSGTSIVEIHPQADADYEIRSIGRTGSAVSTRLRLYRDVKASQRRQYVRQNRGWEIGIEVAGGWHSGFAQTNTPIGAGSEPDAGTDLEVCFAARGAPGKAGFGICAFGVGFQSQRGAQSITWIFTEPRVRLLGGARAGQSNWELGVLFRAGLGLISASSVTPAILAPGLYVARQLRGHSSTGGWSIQASYLRPFYKFNQPVGGGDAPTRNGHRLSLGLGWYR